MCRLSISPSRIRWTTTAVSIRSPRNFGNSTPRDDRADLVPGPTDPLQPARDRRRRLDLDDQIDRAHVDAELEAAGRDHARQPARLQIGLDQRPLLLADRAVVCPGDQRRRGERRAGLSHHWAGEPASGQLQLGSLGGDLVQPGGQALGQPAGVREDDGGLVRGDQVEDVLLDVRPDRRVPWRPGGRPRRLDLGVRQLGHVLDRHDDAQVPLLGELRLDHRHRPLAAEEARDLLDRPDRRRQPDPLGRLGQQGVEPLERERQMRAALGAGDRVHLVDDDRLHAAQRLARLRREQQEQRLGGGDQYVGRLGGESSAARWPACHPSEPRPRRRSAPHRAAGRSRGCRSAAPAGCARRRPPAPSAATRRAPGSAASDRPVVASSRAGRAPTGRPPASCPNPSGRPPVRPGPR